MRLAKVTFGILPKAMDEKQRAYLADQMEVMAYQLRRNAVYGGVQEIDDHSKETTSSNPEVQPAASRASGLSPGGSCRVREVRPVFDPDRSGCVPKEHY